MKSNSWYLLVAAVVGGLVALFNHKLHSIIQMTIKCAHDACSHEADEHMDRIVLPTNVKPTHYDIRIEPDMVNFVFAGKADIKVEFLDDTDTIQLNAKELTVSSANILLGNEKYDAEISLDAEKEVLSLSFPTPIKRGHSGRLALNYSGIINDKMAGFYRSSYTDKATGERRFLGATQFESTDARQAFPCWDEPAIKAKFTITLVIPEHLTGLSNMDVASQDKLPDGRVAIQFHESPIMSTYLIAWVIGDLESIETVNKHNVKVRVFATKGDVSQGRFALDVASRTLDFFTEYFDIPYPLPKMDMVAIPDFSAGAMENWGLVTYRTAYLLYDDENSSLKTKQNIAYVVGHELAHQWFGNLVTMEWWSDLWLNEGFATWVGWLAADHLFPEWDIWTEFIIDDCQAGLHLDGLRSSHPIEVPVKNPAEISQIFDSISYSKGASVIRMLVTYLGEETFRTGLRNYLKKHQYANAKTADLWNALSQASGQPVNSIMNAWTQKMGYPVLEVETTHQSSDLQVSLRQSRFLNSGNVTSEEDKTLWSIPLRLGTNEEPLVNLDATKALLVDKKDTISLPNTLKYFKFNMGQAGFYRVNYPSEWLERLGEAVNQRELHASDRIGLISDAFSMTIAGHLPLTAVLSLLRHFRQEDDYLVWSEISSQLSQMISVWWEQPTDITDSLKSYVADLYAMQVEKLGFDFGPNESDKTRLLRPLVIGMAGKCGHRKIIEEAKSRFERFYKGDTQAIHPNLRGTIYSIVVREGGRAEYESVLSLYNRFSVADQKLAALGSLGCSRQVELVKEALELTKNSNVVRPQDVIYIFRATGSNHMGRRETWSFVQHNWDFFYNRYGIGGGISLLGRVVSSATQEFTQEGDAKSVEEFFVAKSTATIDRTINQSLERIRTNSAWLTKHRDAVAQWLLSNVRRLAA